MAVTNWLNKPITYTLDAVGNRAHMKDPDGHYWTYSWDADGRLVTVWNSYNQTTTLTHDAMGREVQRALANGVSVNRTFDAAGRETNLQAVNAAGAALSGYTATYDPAGNRLTVLELDGTRVTYTHDAANQLTREQRGGAHPIDETLSYDPVGNRVSKVDGTGTTTYQINAANELALTTPPTGAPTTSTWDAAGNLAQEDTGGQKTDYTWDSENRLVRIDKPDGTWETNTYRADGLRQSHEDTDGLVYFVWDDQNVLLEKNSSRVTRAIYTQLPGIWGGAFSFKRGADHYYLLPDFQGHTRHMANATGAIFEPHIYDAWGREIWPIVTTGLYLRGFGQWGYWRDTASREYVRARHLRVDMGRWVSRPPMPLDDGTIAAYALSLGPQATRGARRLLPRAGRTSTPLASATRCADMPDMIRDRDEVLQASVNIAVPVWDLEKGDCTCTCPECWKEKTLNLTVRQSLMSEIQEAFRVIHAFAVALGTPINPALCGSFSWRCTRGCESKHGAQACLKKAASDDGFFDKCMSRHSQAFAIDINTRYNPMAAANPYRDCKRYPKQCCYALDPQGLIVKALTVCWGWGGAWHQTRKDFMHFSKDGR